MTKISERKLAKAKALYMDYETVSEVSRQTGIARSTVSFHVKKENGWEYERNISRAELLDQMQTARKADFAKMTGSTIIVLKRALQTLAERADPPSVQEAKGAASILDILDKITRLDDGNPTDIIASEKPATVIEIREKLKLDPFQEVKEIEYEEITD